MTTRLKDFNIEIIHLVVKISLEPIFKDCLEKYWEILSNVPNSEVQRPYEKSREEVLLRGSEKHKFLTNGTDKKTLFSPVLKRET